MSLRSTLISGTLDLFLSPPVRMHDGLMYIAVCLSVWTLPKFKLDKKSLDQKSYLIVEYCLSKWFQILLEGPQQMQVGSLQLQVFSSFFK